MAEWDSWDWRKVQATLVGDVSANGYTQINRTPGVTDPAPLFTLSNNLAAIRTEIETTLTTVTRQRSALIEHKAWSGDAATAFGDLASSIRQTLDSHHRLLNRANGNNWVDKVHEAGTALKTAVDAVVRLNQDGAERTRQRYLSDYEHWRTTVTVYIDRWGAQHYSRQPPRQPWFVNANGETVYTPSAYPDIDNQMSVEARHIMLVLATAYHTIEQALKSLVVPTTLRTVTPTPPDPPPLPDLNGGPPPPITGGGPPPPGSDVPPPPGTGGAPPPLDTGAAPPNLDVPPPGGAGGVPPPGSAPPPGGVGGGGAPDLGAPPDPNAPGVGGAGGGLPGTIGGAGGGLGGGVGGIGGGGLGGLPGGPVLPIGGGLGGIGGGLGGGGTGGIGGGASGRPPLADAPPVRGTFPAGGGAAGGGGLGGPGSGGGVGSGIGGGGGAARGGLISDALHTPVAGGSGGARGASGAGGSGMPMMPMGGAGGGGGKDDKKERERTTWLQEDRDIWAVAGDVTPGVIRGGDPTLADDGDFLVDGTEVPVHTPTPRRPSQPATTEHHQQTGR